MTVKFTPNEQARLLQIFTQKTQSPKVINLTEHTQIQIAFDRALSAKLRLWVKESGDEG